MEESILKVIGKKLLNIIGAVASAISGSLWAASAHAQMLILDNTGLNANQVAEKLNYLSQHENYWAAIGASVAGFAVFLALIFD